MTVILILLLGALLAFLCLMASAARNPKTYRPTAHRKPSRDPNDWTIVPGCPCVFCENIRTMVRDLEKPEEGPYR